MNEAMEPGPKGSSADIISLAEWKKQREQQRLNAVSPSIIDALKEFQAIAKGVNKMTRLRTARDEFDTLYKDVMSRLTASEGDTPEFTRDVAILCNTAEYIWNNDETIADDIFTKMKEFNDKMAELR